MSRKSVEQNATATAARTLKKKLLLGSLLLAFTVVAGLVIAEVLLRLVPIPGISYHTFYYDRVTGGKHYPGSTLIYRSDRGDVVRRKVNSWGFVDAEHAETPAPGVVRIGFFGDSYTEARQVGQKEFFAPLVEEGLNARGAGTQRYEALAFGVSGRSTLQSYLEARRWSQRARLDWVIYVFVENDPGNQLRVTNRVDTTPYVIRHGDSFAIDSSFADAYWYKDRQPHRTLQFLKSNSLVMSTLNVRVRLLLRRGVKMQVTDLDRDVGGDVNGAPSQWTSKELADEAWGSVEWVLDRWHAEATAAGRRFAVVNVPRANMLETPMDEQDAWAPRLHAFCERSGILLIDPTAELVAAKAVGQEVFYDHLTPQGHRAFAEAIVSAILRETKGAE